LFKKLPHSKDTVRVALNILQPSQVYISSAKLAQVQAGCDLHHLEPLPVALRGDTIYLTDGHTRALAAYLAGIRSLLVYWDDDDLDWEAYSICVDWCQEADIFGVPDLSDHILQHDEYERLWYGRCRAMQTELELKRQPKPPGHNQTDEAATA
jgi:hypothetical protein